MTRFEDIGFLSDEAQELGRQRAAELATVIERCQELISDSHAEVYAIRGTTLRERVAAVLFVRALELFQAILILTPLGLENAARVQLRSLAECLFTLGAIREDDDLLARYVNQGRIEYCRRVEAARRSKSPYLEELRSPEIKAKYDLVKLHARQSDQLRVEDLARAAGMQDWYDTVYRALSPTVHAGVADLERSVEATGKGVAVKYGPPDTGHLKLLGPAAEMMYLCLSVLSDVYGRDLQAKLFEYQTFVNGLSGLRGVPNGPLQPPPARGE
jgi:hypothetical protein